MMPDPLLFIEPEKLAASGRELSGHLDLVEMTRLLAQIRNPDASVTYRLGFSKDDRGLVHIDGEITTRLDVTCQRCLEAMSLPVRDEVRIAVIREATPTDALADDVEPFETEDKQISLVRLVEEQLLLALPIAPMHDERTCPASSSVKEHRTPERANPFAVLKNIRTDKS